MWYTLLLPLLFWPSIPMYYAIPIDLSAKDAGVIYGMLNTFAHVAAVVAPALPGFIVVLSGSHWEYALYVAAFIIALGAVTISLVKIKTLDGETQIETAG